MNIIDMRGRPLAEGDSVQLRIQGPTGVQVLHGAIKHLYRAPEAVTLTLAQPALIFDPQLKGLVRRAVGEDVYVSLPGFRNPDGDFLCCRTLDGVDYGAMKVT